MIIILLVVMQLIGSSYGLYAMQSKNKTAAAASSSHSKPPKTKPSAQYVAAASPSDPEEDESQEAVQQHKTTKVKSQQEFLKEEVDALCDGVDKIPLGKKAAETSTIAYFSPGIKPVIAKLIKDEQKSIEGACYEFTLFDLAKLWAAKKVPTKLIVNDKLDKYKNKPDSFLKLPHALLWLKLHGIDVSSSILRSEYANMHHKFFIFGENGNTRKPLVVTGSFNWTGQAEERNYEDIVILNEEKVIEQYRDHYSKIPSKPLDVSLLLLYKIREELKEPHHKLEWSKTTNCITASDEILLMSLLAQRGPGREQLIAVAREIEAIDEQVLTTKFPRKAKAGQARSVD